MKRIERRKLKGNEFVDTIEALTTTVAEHQRGVTIAAIAIVGLLLIVGTVVGIRNHRNSAASDELARGLAIAEAPVVAPPAPAPGSPAPVQQPGTYRTERARAEAALPLLLKAANDYPSTTSGITARYRSATILNELGRYQEAEQRFREVVDQSGQSSIYHRTARLGLAEALAGEGKYDEAVTTLKELATDTNSQLPVDGILMQLGRTAMQGGKTDEATRAFTRVVNEFPQSVYASEAREKISELKKA